MIRNKAEDYAPPTDKLFGIYRGVIEDNNDTEMAGRCKVRVFGVHTDAKAKGLIEGIPTDELPWCEPAFSLFEGSISGFGAWSIPVQGSHVFVFFESGNIMQPRYFATVPGIPTEAPNEATLLTEGFQDPDGVYPLAAAVPPLEPNALNEPDVHKLARGIIQSTIVNEKKERQITDIETADGNTWNEPLPYYDARYPENIVLATHGGIVAEFDNTVLPAEGAEGTETGKRRVHIYHPSHTFIEISEEGDISFRNERDRFEIVTRNRKIYIIANEDKTINENQTLYVKKDKTEKVDRHVTATYAKDYNLEIGNEYNISVAADKSESIDGNQSLDVGGNLTITVQGNCDIAASGAVRVTAPSIDLT